MIIPLKILRVAAVALISTAATTQATIDSHSSQPKKPNAPSIAPFLVNHPTLDKLNPESAVSKKINAFYRGVAKAKAQEARLLVYYTGVAAAKADQARQVRIAAWYKAAAPRPAVHTTAPQVGTVSSGGIPYSFSLWMGVHNCEQPETWHAGGYFGNGLAAGGNGLGFSADAWAMGVRMAARRGVTIPSSGWAASPDQQMQLAQAVLDATGGGPDCLHR